MPNHARASTSIVVLQQNELNEATQLISLDDPEPKLEPKQEPKLKPKLEPKQVPKLEPKPDPNPEQRLDSLQDIFSGFDASPKPAAFVPEFDFPDFGRSPFSGDPFSPPKAGFEPTNMLAMGQVDNKYAVFRQLALEETSPKPFSGNTGTEFHFSN